MTIKNKTYQKLWHLAKVVHKGKYVDLNGYVTEEESSKITGLMFCL